MVSSTTSRSLRLSCPWIRRSIRTSRRCSVPLRALAISGVPFNGPIGAARVGYKEGKYLLNPDAKELSESALHLVVAGTEKAVLMVESEARGLSEEVMLGSVVFGHEQMQVAIRAIKELAAEVGKPRWKWEPAADNADLGSAVALHAHAAMGQAYSISEKQQRYARIARSRRRHLPRSRRRQPEVHGR